PGGAVGPVELVDQVFGHPLDVGPDAFDPRGALLGSRHPGLLSELRSEGANAFPPDRVRPGGTSCKPCRAPPPCGGHEPLCDCCERPGGATAAGGAGAFGELTV